MVWDTTSSRVDVGRHQIPFCLLQKGVAHSDNALPRHSPLKTRMPALRTTLGTGPWGKLGPNNSLCNTQGSLWQKEMLDNPGTRSPGVASIKASKQMHITQTTSGV